MRSRKITSMTLCDECRSVFSRVRSPSAQTWVGPKPRSFSYPQRSYLWGGSHHIQQGSFLRAVRERCYVCVTIFRDCNEAQQQIAESFQIFYQIYYLSSQAASDERHRYGLRFGIETKQKDRALFGEFFYDCQGDFKVLPYEGVSCCFKFNRATRVRLG